VVSHRFLNYFYATLKQSSRYFAPRSPPAAPQAAVESVFLVHFHKYYGRNLVNVDKIEDMLSQENQFQR
jgi:hypothetical protein